MPIPPRLPARPGDLANGLALARSRLQLRACEVGARSLAQGRERPDLHDASHRPHGAGARTMTRRSTGKTRIARSLWYAAKRRRRAAAGAAAAAEARRGAGAHAVQRHQPRHGAAGVQRGRRPKRVGAHAWAQPGGRVPVSRQIRLLRDRRCRGGPGRAGRAAPCSACIRTRTSSSCRSRAWCRCRTACRRGGRRWPPTWRRRSTRSGTRAPARATASSSWGPAWWGCWSRPWRRGCRAPR